MQKCPACHKRSLQAGTSAGLNIVFCHECGYKGPALEFEPAQKARRKRGSGETAPKRARRWCPTEGQEQEAYFRLVDQYMDAYPELSMIYAVPNGAYKSMAARMRFQKEGLRPGVPDINCDVPRGAYNGLRIELKRLYDSKTSPEQIDWLERLNLMGYLAIRCYGAEEAWTATTEYLGIDPAGLSGTKGRTGDDRDRGTSARAVARDVPGDDAGGTAN